MLTVLGRCSESPDGHTLGGKNTSVKNSRTVSFTQRIVFIDFLIDTGLSFHLDDRIYFRVESLEDTAV